jgi:hypothetical protein
MKKNTLILTCLAVLSITLYACSGGAGTKTDSVKTTDSSSSMKDSSMMKQPIAVVYTCKMHPEVTSDKPGKCPKCGMDLVKKEDIMKDSTMKDMKMDSTKH